MLGFGTSVQTNNVLRFGGAVRMITISSSSLLLSLSLLLMLGLRVMMSMSSAALSAEGAVEGAAAPIVAFVGFLAEVIFGFLVMGGAWI